MNSAISISVQTADFDLAQEHQVLHEDNATDGATATFCGRVRNNNLDSDVVALHLEHYPGMTEKQLQKIAEHAAQQWQLGRIRIVHRIGQLNVGEQIVFVGVTSKHRQNAFLACEFIMDYLKVNATFWKKELTNAGEYRWLDAKQSDHNKAQDWDEILNC